MFFFQVPVGEQEAMLVLLPRQYFFNFYGNRSTDPDSEKNVICQNMFKVSSYIWLASIFLIKIPVRISDVKWKKKLFFLDNTFIKFIFNMI